MGVEWRQTTGVAVVLFRLQDGGEVVSKCKALIVTQSNGTFTSSWTSPTG